MAVFNSPVPNWFCNSVTVNRPTASYIAYVMDCAVLPESTFIWESQIWSQSHYDLSPKWIALSSKVLSEMRISVILNWPHVKVWLKTALQPVVDTSVVILNEGSPIFLVLNDPRILFFHQIISCFPSESIELFLSKLSLLNFSAFRSWRSRSQ